MNLNYFSEKKKDLSNKSEINSLFDKVKTNLTLLKDFIEESLEKKNLFISFNGGKDCTASLLLLKYYFYCASKQACFGEEKNFIDFIENQANYQIDNNYVKLVYFIKNDVFEEEIDFCFYLAKKEKVKLILLQSNYKMGLHYLKNVMNLETIFMGIRKDDYYSERPISERDIVQHSDGNYPSFYRLYPVFQFTYREIWVLLLQSKYDYLNLYDQGYTSIGTKSKTSKNSKLELKEFHEKRKDIISSNDSNQITDYLKKLDSNSKFYLPAYFLEELDCEREFRK
jgi:FAD synthetase